MTDLYQNSTNMRRTKIVCTIGPKTCTKEMLEKLIKNGMNIARLNLSHGSHEWHAEVIKNINEINTNLDFPISIMLDTKGPETRTGDLKNRIKLNVGDHLTLTIEQLSDYPAYTTKVNYEGFVNDVEIGDILLIDGGIISLEVIEKNEKSIVTKCLEEGILTSRRHLNIKGKSVQQPSITDQDWDDIKFAIEHNLDFIALSFTKDAATVKNLKDFLQQNNSKISVIAKIESVDAVNNLEEIIEAADGLMVARGDLAAELPFEEVPLIQEGMILSCRKYNKPVIVATQLLESMMTVPTPTRAEVSDISTAVKQKTDAIMLSGETAAGEYPIKSVQTMDRVANRMEALFWQTKDINVEHSSDVKYEVVRSASIIANYLEVKALVVFTKSGYTAEVISKCRPNPLICAFTDSESVRKRMNLYWGLVPFRIDFAATPEETVEKAIQLMRKDELVSQGDKIVIVSDILVNEEYVETIQVREI